MKTLRSLLVAAAAILVATTAARAADWTEDYASAVAKARKEHKMVLLDFTGSDWCIWCQRTDKEVFSTQKFKDYADQKLVLVKLDFPQTRVMPDAVKAQNAALQEKFGIDSFPTLVVLDSKGKVAFSQLGYKEGGPEAFIDALEKKITAPPQ
jgi:thioredoxin-related protein